MYASRSTVNLGVLLALLGAIGLTGCGGGDSNSSSTMPGTLSVTSTALANGQVGKPYSSTLSASGGTSPYSWSLTAGTLPAGLTLAASGTLSGTPTATAVRTPLTFKVTDSAASPQSQSVTLPLAVSPANITVSVTPARAGLVLQQQMSLTVTTNDNAGVGWSVTPAGGTFSAQSSLDGGTVTFTAATAPGVYTLKATSLTDATVAGAVTVGVTDLAGVYTYHNDLARDGVNAQEYALTPADVNTASFGKLFSCTVDGAVYAQPLWVASLSVGGKTRNVVFIATQHDGLFAFDADQTPCTQLWKVSLIDTAHGGASGEVPVPAGVSGYLVGQGPGSDITPEVGVTGTPVIDPVAKILYVVSKSASGSSVVQRLHAIDVSSGNEKAGSPVTIAATFPGSGDGGTHITFKAGPSNQRPGLALVNNVVYICWGSHDDTPTWYGWVIGYRYSGSAFAQTAVFSATPNVAEGGIWMSGGAPAADGAGHLYVITGNGGFDASSGTAPNNDYGDSFLQLTGSLAVSSWFTPSDQATDNSTDNDFGSGGSALVLNVGSGSPQHLVVGGGKDATLYLLDGDHMGGLGDANSRQNFSLGASNSIFSSAAFWNNTLYINPINASLAAYAFSPGTQLFTTTPSSRATPVIGFPGATPAISASSASANGVVWEIDSHNYCTAPATTCTPAVLHAFSAANLATELWNSSMVAADVAGNPVQFTVPTVANGKVYIGTRGNNTGGAYGSSTISGELDVYGLKP